jgi:hypothetical protein
VVLLVTALIVRAEDYKSVNIFVCKLNMKLHFICIRLESMAHFRRMHQLFDKIIKRNALYAFTIRVGVGYCNLCSCMGPSDKSEYFEDFV